jgi:integrase
MLNPEPAFDPAEVALRADGPCASPLPEAAEGRDQLHRGPSVLAGEVIDVAAVARMLHVGRNTVYALVARNARPHRRLDKQIRFHRGAIAPWDFEQYARLLAAARVEGPGWYAAVCLAGEAGCRSGEVKALRWREDVDLVAKTITVNQQTCYGVTTTPKGRNRRTIPMTSTLEHALRRLEVVREGFVVRNLDGSAKTDGQANAVILRICRRAGLPAKRWHTLRHTFGTHAALFGVNP